MTDPFPLDAAHVVVFHDACLDSGKWPAEEAPAHPPGAIWPWIEENHGCNARLLRAQDPTRHPDADIDAGPNAPGRVERQRGEAIARIDGLLLAGPRGDGAAAERGETPGTTIDALSRLAVRMKVLAGELARGDAPPDTARAGRERLAAMESERLALAQRLQALLAHGRGGSRLVPPR